MTGSSPTTLSDLHSRAQRILKLKKMIMHNLQKEAQKNAQNLVQKHANGNKSHCPTTVHTATVQLASLYKCMGYSFDCFPWKQASSLLDHIIAPIWANPIEATAQIQQKMQSEGHYAVAHQHQQLQKLIKRPNILAQTNCLRILSTKAKFRQTCNFRVSDIRVLNRFA